MQNELFLILRESAQVIYGEEEQRPFYYEKELVRARLVLELNERLGYPLSSIHLDALVLVEGDGFQQIDVVARSQNGDVMIVAATEPAQVYESLREERMRGLYKQASVVARAKRVHCLVYYTGWYEKSQLRKRQVVVDYAAYPTYRAWRAAGFPSGEFLPAYRKEQNEQ
ncbi:MAG: hypothetical protein Q8P39_03670 [Candidatus Yanofskybacteria bacterium]|nr:hypothetical protein [Candidatus Yanofskybacteria bacterium]